MKIYRKIWEENYGKIPKDSEGRTFEIHHLDGNHNNNKIENLRECNLKQNSRNSSKNINKNS